MNNEIHSWAVLRAPPQPKPRDDCPKMKSDDAPTTWLRVEPSPSTASQPVETASLIDAPRREPTHARQWFGIILGIAVLFGVVGGGAYWALHRTSDAPLAEIAPAPAAPKPTEPTMLLKTSEPVAAASTTTPAPEAADAPAPNLVFGSGPILGQAPPPEDEERTPATPPPARTAQAPPPAAPPPRKVHVQRAPPPAAAAATAPAPPTGSAAGIRF